MMSIRNISFLILCSSLFFIGCATDTTKGWQGPKTAFGAINQIVVIADKNLWEGPLGDSIDFYFGAPYLVLPQPEPIFDLVHFTPQNLLEEPVRKEFKTYLIVADMNDEDSPTTQLAKRDLGNERLRQTQELKGYANTVARDKWAQQQTLVYMYGFGEDKLVENIQKSSSAVIKRIRNEELARVNATLYMGGENRSLSTEIQGNLGVGLRIPVGYVKAIYAKEDNFMWLRRDTRDVNSNILIHRISYTTQAQLSRDSLKAIRNSLGRKYVSTSMENTYMRINDVDLPMFVEQIDLNNYYALEARGIWDIVNDYMGGPFISYLVHNPEKNELFFLDGFVHAPGEEKRDHMQALEEILASVSF